MNETTVSIETDNRSEPEYNKVFERFVGTEGMEDIIGIVAYGIYKNAKREWTMDFRKNYNRSPTADELRAYHFTWTPAQIQSARNSAAQVMTEYADSIINQEEPRILKDALRGTFWTSVGNSIFANAVYTLMLLALAIILSKAGIDLLGLVSDQTKTPKPAISGGPSLP